MAIWCTISVHYWQPLEPPMLFGMPVVFSEYIPERHVADKLKPVLPYWAPLHRWVFRVDPLPRFYAPGGEIKREQEYIIGGTWFFSKELYQEMMGHVMVEKPDLPEVPIPLPQRDWQSIVIGGGLAILVCLVLLLSLTPAG